VLGTEALPSDDGYLSACCAPSRQSGAATPTAAAAMSGELPSAAAGCASAAWHGRRTMTGSSGLVVGGPALFHPSHSLPAASDLLLCGDSDFEGTRHGCSFCMYRFSRCQSCRLCYLRQESRYTSRPYCSKLVICLWTLDSKVFASHSSETFCISAS
jgi:hypothetical protein